MTMALNLGKIAKQVLKTVAPLAATAVGSPALGGVVSKLIGTALGESDEALIEQKLAEADPATLTALKNIDKDLRIEMKRLGIQEQEIYLADTQDARGMAKHFGKIWPQFSIAVALTLMIAAVIYALFWVNIPEGSAEVLYMVLGALLREWGASISFFVGTTKGSQDKSTASAIRPQQ